MKRRVRAIYTKLRSGTDIISNLTPSTEYQEPSTYVLFITL